MLCRCNEPQRLLLNRHLQFTGRQIRPRARHFVRSRMRGWMRRWGRGRRWFVRFPEISLQKISQPLAATMLEPVAKAHGENRDHRYRQEHACDTGQLRARKDREDHRERMKMDAMPNQAWIDDIVLQYTQRPQKKQHDKSGSEAGIKNGGDGREDGNKQ